MFYLVAFIAPLLLVATYLYSVARPGIKSLRGGIHALLRLGRDQAEIKFTNLRTGKTLRFRKEMVGGLPTVTLSVKELKLSDDENKRLAALIANKKLRTKWHKSRKFLLLGSSIDEANDVSAAILADVLCMSKYARFRYEHEGIVFPDPRRKLAAGSLLSTCRILHARTGKRRNQWFNLALRRNLAKLADGWRDFIHPRACGTRREGCYFGRAACRSDCGDRAAIE